MIDDNETTGADAAADAATETVADAPAKTKRSRKAEALPVLVSMQTGDAPWQADAIWDLVSSGPSFVMLGDSDFAHPQLAPIACAPADWERSGGRVLLMRTIDANGLALTTEGLRLATFGLAAAAEGPVLALCDIGGAPMMRAGSAFSFPRGAILFG